MTEPIVTDQVDERLVQESVNFINMKVAESVLKGSLEIGDYLLANFFGNDIQLAASQNPLKAASYSALSRRPDLGVSRTTLARMVRIAAQERFFILRRIRTDNLSYAHRIELIKLENNDKKIELVRQCVSESLSSRQLIFLINEVRSTAIKSREISAASLAKKHVSALRHLTDGSAAPAFLYDREQLKAIPKETRDNLRQTATELLSQIPNITRLYESVITNLDQITIELEE